MGVIWVCGKRRLVSIRVRRGRRLVQIGVGRGWSLVKIGVRRGGVSHQWRSKIRRVCHVGSNIWIDLDIWGHYILHIGGTRGEFHPGPDVDVKVLLLGDQTLIL